MNYPYILFATCTEIYQITVAIYIFIKLQLSNIPADENHGYTARTRKAKPWPNLQSPRDPVL